LALEAHLEMERNKGVGKVHEEEEHVKKHELSDKTILTLEGFSKTYAQIQWECVCWRLGEGMCVDGPGRAEFMRLI
jgi:hypothetical protein